MVTEEAPAVIATKEIQQRIRNLLFEITIIFAFFGSQFLN
jgi:hypothetical protein